MHITYGEEFFGGQKFTYGRAVVTKNLLIKEADESVYSFLERNEKLPFDQNMSPEYAKEFVEIIEGLSDEQLVYFVAPIKDYRDIWHMMNVQIRKLLIPVYGEDRYELILYDIMRVEKEYFIDLQKMSKYRTIMGIVDYVYFEYTPETGGIVFYTYFSLKAHKLYEGTIEDCLALTLQYGQQDEKNLLAIQLLYDKIIQCVNQYQTVIYSGLLNKDREIEKLQIDFEFCAKHHQKMIIGVVRKLDLDENHVPYYMTKAGKDATTGLLNKRASIDYSEEVLTPTGEQKHYMMLIDIDDFKSINDTYGHDMGDKVIMLVANVLKEGLSGRGIVGRFGGDEFYILTDYIWEEMLLRTFIRATNSKLRQEIEDRQWGFHVTLSIGISLYPDNGRDYHELFALADKALYIGKEKGKNRFIIYRPELHDSIKVIGAGNIGMAKSQDHTKALKIAVSQLLSRGKACLDETLSLICETFGIDSISVYTGKELALLQQTGDNRGVFPEAFFMREAAYRDSFDENHVLRLNEIDHLKGTCPEILQQLEERQFCSLLQIAYPDSKAPEMLISFENIERKHKWNENDINYMSVLGSVIYEVTGND